MSKQSAYKQQQNLALMQLLLEAPAFIVTLLSAIIANTMILFVDLMDSFGNLLRTAMVTLLSKKLSNDLRFEYNYGVGKIEALASLFCNGIVFFGLALTLGMSVYSLFYPETPRDSVIAVVGLKVINVSFDTAFFIKQRRILKIHRSAISETNYAAALAALLFDSVTLVSLLLIWALRNNPIGGYISPVISIFVAVYLLWGCVKRTRAALEDLTDKTLPEDIQMKMLSVLTRHYDRFSQFHSINSHKYGELIMIDLHLSFEKNTSYEEIVDFKSEIQREFEALLGSCVTNIVVSQI